MKFHCSSSLCFNNFKTKDENGVPMKFYRLPRDESIQSEYRKIFQTDGMDWKKGRICAAHWSCGERKDSKHLPDVPVPEEQLKKLQEKCLKAKKRFETLTDTDGKFKESYKNAKRKYEVALTMPSTLVHRKHPATLSGNPSSSGNPSPSSGNPSSSSTKKVKRLSKGQLKRKLAVTDNEVDMLKGELGKANETVDIQKSEIKRLKEELNQQKKNNIDLEMKNLYLSGAALNLRAKDFKYENLKSQQLTFKSLTGLTVKQFDLLADCIAPYVHLIPYPDCSNNSEKSVDSNTQFLSVLTICRHGLDFQLMAYILEKSVSTVSRIFSSWVVFLATLFNRLNLNPGSGYILKKMPKIFFETGHELTDLIIDATEFKFQNASNFELSSLMFSNYKNNATGKALIGISPHGMGIFFSDIYPGSISDSEITEKVGVLQYVEEGHEIMSDRGFAIQDLCAIKGITLNRPKQKEGEQFNQSDVKTNFDIAATRIHVERYIGRVRGWKILNQIWPLKQMDLLSSTWQMLCHIVNITMPPIGPKV